MWQRRNNWSGVTCGKSLVSMFIISYNKKCPTVEDAGQCEQCGYCPEVLLSDFHTIQKILQI